MGETGNHTMATFADENVAPRAVDFNVAATLLKDVKTAPRPSKRSLDDDVHSDISGTPDGYVQPASKRRRVFSTLAMPFGLAFSGVGWLSAKMIGGFSRKSVQRFNVGDSVEVNWVEDGCEEENWLQVTVQGYHDDNNVLVKFQADGSIDVCPISLVRMQC